MSWNILIPKFPEECPSTSLGQGFIPVLIICVWKCSDVLGSWHLKASHETFNILVSFKPALSCLRFGQASKYINTEVYKIDKDTFYGCSQVRGLPGLGQYAV